jgi:hypothetical protein
MIEKADVILGSTRGTKAMNVPIQVIDQTTGLKPANCPAHHSWNPKNFNGLLGISPSIDDGGSSYFSCGDEGCVPANVSRDLKVQNVIGLLPLHNNGYEIRFPAIPAGGLPSVNGEIVLGLGTAENNQLPASLRPLLPTNPRGGIRVAVGSQVYPSGVDTGTQFFNLPLPGIAGCPPKNVYLCPETPLDLSVTVLDHDGRPYGEFSLSIVSFKNVSPQMHALNDVAERWPGGTQLMLGMPFFFGRTVYFALAGKATPVGPGPWIAF